MAESTDDTIEATFVWGADCDPHGGKKLTLHMLESELAKRDPDGKSTIAAKMRFTNSLAFEMAPTGPSDDEYMSPSLIEYVWGYMKEGKLDVTPTVMPEDAERALEYFGFSGCTVTVPESDPFYIGKMVAYRVHTESMAAAPGIVEWIKTKILKCDMSDAGMHLIVDDKSGVKMDQFGQTIDLVVQHYSPSDLKPGTLVTRLGGYAYKDEFLNATKMYRMLSGDEKTATALRQKILGELQALGGIDSEWKEENLHIMEQGEYGVTDYLCGDRYVLRITLDDSMMMTEEGIKRRKLE